MVDHPGPYDPTTDRTDCRLWERECVAHMNGPMKTRKLLLDANLETALISNLLKNEYLKTKWYKAKWV